MNADLYTGGRVTLYMSKRGHPKTVRVESHSPKVPGEELEVILGWENEPERVRVIGGPYLPVYWIAMLDSTGRRLVVGSFDGLQDYSQWSDVVDGWQLQAVFSARPILYPDLLFLLDKLHRDCRDSLTRAMDARARKHEGATDG